jgi:hypothetical protein
MLGVALSSHLYPRIDTEKGVYKLFGSQNNGGTRRKEKIE